MSIRDRNDLPKITIGNKLSAAFDDLEKLIRERAYHIFLDRDPEGADPVADWLEAQSGLVSPVELEIKEQKKNLVVEANLKGFSTDEIEIEVEGNTLKIFGSHQEPPEEKKDRKTRGRETASRSIHFYNAVTLPARVNADETHAKLFKNGKLKVTLPKIVTD